MKKTFTIAPDFAVEYGIISGPVHHDGCDHEPNRECWNGEAHGNRCVCRKFVPSGEKEGK